MQHRLTSTLSTGVRLDYAERGPAEGTPVVFLHGITDSWRSFEPVLRRLPATIRALAVTARGHGDSDHPETGYSCSDMSDDLRAFLDALGVHRAVVVGHSMGAMVAQRFAIDNPDRLAGLVLIGAFSTLYRDVSLSQFVASAIDPLTDPIDPAFAREWQLSTTAQPLDSAFLDTVVAETLKVPARVWHAAFHGFLTTPGFSRELARISVPASLFWGDRDTYAVRTHQEALRAALPQAQLHTYEGYGHAPHWEDPARFAADLETFLSQRLERRENATV